MRTRPRLVLAALLLAVPLHANSTPFSASSARARPFLTALSVTSVERTTAWYSQHLGFRLVQGPTAARPGIVAALLELDGFYLEVVSLAGSRARVSALPNPENNGSLQGAYKLGFWVSDADSAARSMTAAGVALYRGPGVDSSLAGGVRYFLVKDPDETVIQIFAPLRRGE